MIGHPAFPAEPWSLRETALQLEPRERLAQVESVFALSNGHIGWRANLDEGEPHGVPGAYLNGVWEERPLLFGERGFGFPESGQSMVNVTDGKVIRLLVDDEPFDVRYGALREHTRVLDFRTGVLSRRAEWVSPAGSRVRVSSRRLVSFAQRAVAAIQYEVTPLDREARIVVQSELVANEQLPATDQSDPRVPAMIESALVREEDQARARRAVLIHRTRSSGLRVGAAMDHLVAGPDGVDEVIESEGDLARLTLSTRLPPGQSLRLVKFVAYGWSSERSRPAMRDQVEGALDAAMRSGWDGLLAEQSDFLDEFWRGADVEVDGDDEIQQAVRFALFHVLQAGARGEEQAIPAKGLTGPGYDGHAFWDTEMFVLPLLTQTLPDAAGAALRWRHATLELAQDRARELGLRGAAFPWRTIAGKECSGYWPAGTAAFHINADIAAAVTRHAEMTGDAEFDAGPGLDLLVNTARLWCSLGHFDAAGRYRIAGVTGPDEYSALADDNVYTNLMAQQNLVAAAAAVRRHPDDAAVRLGAGDDEADGWLAAAEAMAVPFDETLGVHPQAEGFTQHQEWDFAAMTEDSYPLMMHFPYFDLYRKQVVKQADLVLAMAVRPECFTDEQKARNFAYYERLTVRDSSLSAFVQAILAAEVGHLDLAYDYVAESALMDLDDERADTGAGVHIAALAGTWLALVSGFGGLRHPGGRHPFTFAPRLPAALKRLSFGLRLRGRQLRVEVTRSAAVYRLTGEGGAVEILHHGEPLTLSPGQPAHALIPALPARPRPSQPPGREPVRRSAGGQRGGPGSAPAGQDAVG